MYISNCFIQFWKEPIYSLSQLNLRKLSLKAISVLTIHLHTVLCCSCVTMCLTFHFWNLEKGSFHFSGLIPFQQDTAKETLAEIASHRESKFVVPFKIGFSVFCRRFKRQFITQHLRIQFILWKRETSKELTETKWSQSYSHQRSSMR